MQSAFVSQRSQVRTLRSAVAAGLPGLTPTCAICQSTVGPQNAGTLTTRHEHFRGAPVTDDADAAGGLGAAAAADADAAGGLGAAAAADGAGGAGRLGATAADGADAVGGLGGAPAGLAALTPPHASQQNATQSTATRPCTSRR